MVSYGVLTIEMSRNTYAPEFNATQYFSNIEWRLTPGQVIDRVFAIDRDNVSIYAYVFLTFFECLAKH